MYFAIAHWPAELLLLALEPDVLLDDLEAVARQRQGNRALGDRQQIEEVLADPSGDTISTSIRPHVEIESRPLHRTLATLPGPS